MTCTLTCGAFNSMLDECRNNPCIAVVKGLDYCCPTNGGAIAGLVIGILVFCIASCVGCWFCCFRTPQPVVIMQNQPGMNQGMGQPFVVQQGQPQYQQPQQGGYQNPQPYPTKA